MTRAPAPRDQVEDPHRYASVALLVELVSNTLDPGYAAAAARRKPNAPRQRWERPAVAVGCLLIGLVLAVAYAQTHRGAPAAKKLHDRLVGQARSAGDRAGSLADQAEELGSQLEQIRRSALSGSERSALSRAELAAGIVAATGPGITVTLGQPATSATSTGGASTGRQGTTPITSTALINDRDIRAVVNELWADGGEAISINNVRLTPTSAIRFAGQAVLVDFQPLLAPYVIRVIGDRSGLITSFAGSAVASRYQTLITARGITFTFAESKKLTLPAAPESTLRYAKPVPSTSATPASSRPASPSSTGSPTR